GRVVGQLEHEIRGAVLEDLVDGAHVNQAVVERVSPALRARSGPVAPGEGADHEGAVLGNVVVGAVVVRLDLLAQAAARMRLVGAGLDDARGRVVVHARVPHDRQPARVAVDGTVGPRRGFAVHGIAVGAVGAAGDAGVVAGDVVGGVRAGVGRQGEQ